MRAYDDLQDQERFYLVVTNMRAGDDLQDQERCYSVMTEIRACDDLQDSVRGYSVAKKKKKNEVEIFVISLCLLHIVFIFGRCQYVILGGRMLMPYTLYVCLLQSENYYVS